LPRPIAERQGGTAKVIRMMVAVNTVDHLDRHAQEACRFPFVDARLHGPRRGGVAQRVRADLAADASQAKGF
jgi:hypothetical protein